MSARTGFDSVATVCNRFFGVQPPGSRPLKPEDRARQYRCLRTVVDVLPQGGDRPGTLRAWIHDADGNYTECSVGPSTIRALEDAPVVAAETVGMWRTAAWTEVQLDEHGATTTAP